MRKFICQFMVSPDSELRQQQEVRLPRSEYDPVYSPVIEKLGELSRPSHERGIKAIKMAMGIQEPISPMRFLRLMRIRPDGSPVDRGAIAQRVESTVISGISAKAEPGENQAQVTAEKQDEYRQSLNAVLDTVFAIDFHVIQEVQQQEQRATQEQRPELNPDRALLACQVRQRFSGITLRSEADIASMISEMNATIFGLDERRSQRRDTEIYSVGDVIMKFPNGIFGNSLDSGLTITPSKDATSGFKLRRVAV